MASWKASLIQMDSGSDEKENMRKAEYYIRQAALEGACLAVLPETVDYIGRGMKDHAKELPGEWGAFLSEQAKRYGIYIHGGSVTEKNPGGRPYNTSLFYAPDGNMIGKYRKLHMFDVEVEEGPSYRESDDICPGNEIVLCETELGCFGLSICYDLRFPELYRIQSRQGAQVLIAAANFTYATGEKHWEILLRARAIENTCYVLACCQCGKKPAFTAYGHSMIVSPWGEVLAGAGTEEGLITASLNLEEVKKVRKQIPSLNNIRTDICHLSSDRVKVFAEK
ncbi:MAG: carbon-nitrogen hydrolase family protein [Ruminococcus sp.]|jgi:predicted amidohydrolase